MGTLLFRQTNGLVWLKIFFGIGFAKSDYILEMVRKNTKLYVIFIGLIIIFLCLYTTYSGSGKFREAFRGSKTKIFNLDLHQSVIEDIKDIVVRLYEGQVEITNWSISAHNHQFNKPTADVKYINQSNWKDINTDIIKKFQDEYDDFLKGFDAFVVTHTPVFAMLYEKYGKPIIIVNTCRYDQPFCWNKNKDMLKALNEALQRMQRSGQLTVVSNNVPDQKYLKERAGVDSIYIPSLCLYTKAAYNPIRKEFVLFEKKIFDKFKNILNSSILANRPSDYNFKDLFEYKGIVHMPYENSVMSLFEQYFAGVPLFFPTKEFYKECYRNGTVDYTFMYDSWGTKLSNEEIDKWLNYADYYTFKYINYYSSFEDCISKLNSFKDDNFDERLSWIEGVKNDALGKWKIIFNKFVDID